MYTDLFGKPRYKVNLHMHTTLSDGHLSPVEAVQRYRAEGYDAVALTDHWFFGSGSDVEGMTILPGGEYNVRQSDASVGVYHIVGIGMTRQPSVTKQMSVQELIDSIRAAHGWVILGHPAWSLNTPEQISALRGIDAVEIYNTVSGVHNSRRPDSSLIVDMLACQGRVYPLVADDDAHYYDGTDDCVSWIMVEAEDNSREALMRGLRRGSFYATQGPEVHLLRDGDGYTVKSSPVREIVFLSNLAASKRAFEGTDLTEAHYVPRENEHFLRAQVKDAQGRMAWTNIVLLNEE
ncbi:MAG: hypothetical protein IJW30_01845 [Clostridia bacterium]|nr:hypothetical protein [Clostridia bacterium]